MVLDRACVPGADDQLWRSLDFTIINGIGVGPTAAAEEEVDGQQQENGGVGGSLADWPHFRPVTPPHCQEDEDRLQFPLLSRQQVAAAAGAAVQQHQSQASSSLTNGLGTRQLDSVAAHNTASAVVTKKELEIFSVGLPENSNVL